jgi:DNA-binding MarR family transcriptional regulator
MSSIADPDVRELGRAYLDAVALLEPVQGEIWRAAQLTLTQLRALRRLRHSPKTTGELGRELGLAPASMTRVIDRLEERGLVERKRDEEDRRRVLLVITARGERLLGETRLLEGTNVHRAVEQMSPTERRRVTEALRLLVERVRALEAEEEVVGARR